MSARPGEVTGSEDSCGGLGVSPVRESVDGEPPSATRVRAGSTSAAPMRSGPVDTWAAATGTSRTGPSSMRALFPDGDESDAAAVQCPRSASASRFRRSRPGLVAAMLARVRPASASSWARSCQPKHFQCLSLRRHPSNPVRIIYAVSGIELHRCLCQEGGKRDIACAPVRWSPARTSGHRSGLCRTAASYSSGITSRTR